LAADSDLVMTCLPTSKEVQDAIFAGDGLAAGLKKGSIIADMTTGDPNATRAMARDLATAGITLIDAPVSGGPHGADAGTIAIMVGAAAEVYAQVQPIFASISPNIFHCGAIGNGHTMKLVNNVVAASVRAATFEAVTMGIKAGLSLETCAMVLAKGSARSYTTEITLPKFVTGELKTNFTLGLMHKDVRLATELGVASAAPMPVCNLVREIFQTAVNEQGADADVNCLVHLNDRRAEVDFAPKRRASASHPRAPPRFAPAAGAGPGRQRGDRDAARLLRRRFSREDRACRRGRRGGEPMDQDELFR